MQANTQSKVEINLPYGELSPTIDWCEHNCSGNWVYTMVQPAGATPGEYAFYFEEEKDKFAFMLWKK